MAKGDRLYYSASKELESGGSKKKAHFLVEKASSYANPKACYALATWYIHGEGKIVKKDYKKAFVLLQIAANSNIPDALYDLAVSFETGKGIKKNYSEAYKYYPKAALMGETQSIYEVGRCLFYGIGTKKIVKIAEIWLDAVKYRRIK